MTEDAVLDDIIIWPTFSQKNEKIEKAFKEIRSTNGEKIEPETNFDFGNDDFGWM